MAEPYRLPNGKWQWRYRDPEGRSRSFTHKLKGTVVKFKTTTEAAKLRGDWINPADGKKPFGELAREWQQAQIHRGTTQESVDSMLRNHVFPTFENREIGSIRFSEVQGWVRRLTGVLEPPTVEVAFRYLSSIFK